MQRTRALLGAAALGAALGVQVVTAASAPAQTGVTDTVQQVVPTSPALPTVPSTPTAPGTTTNQSAPSTQSVPQAPTAQDAPTAPATGGPAPSGQAPTKPDGVKPDAKDLPTRPSALDDAPGAGSNGAGSRGDGSRRDPAGSSFAGSSRGGSGSASGSPAGASAAGGSGAAARQGTNAPSTGRRRREPSTAGAFGGAASPQTEASWLDYALDPRYERRFTRRLTETVAELEGCLSQLGARDRRVLTLRSGLAGDGARSRAAVARRLDLTGIGVAVTEQGALRELLSVARSGVCGQGAATAAAGFAAADTVAAGMGGGWVIDRLRLGSSPPPSASDAGFAGSAEDRLGPALLDADPFSRVSVAGPASAPDDGGPVFGVGSWLEMILIALLICLFALLAWLGIARARRSFREPRARRA